MWIKWYLQSCLKVDRVPSPSLFTFVPYLIFMISLLYLPAFDGYGLNCQFLFNFLRVVLTSRLEKQDGLTPEASSPTSSGSPSPTGIVSIQGRRKRLSSFWQEAWDPE